MTKNYYTYKKRYKLIILLGAVIIGAFSSIYTKSLVDELKAEERKKVELWAEATRQLVKPGNNDNSIGLTLEVLKNNTTVPVILTDNANNILHHRNLTVPKKNDETYLKNKLQELKSEGKYIEIDLGDNEKQYLYYQTSTLLIKLTWFPVIQLLVVSIFVFIAYLAFSNSRKAEQNQVWVGMSKETAHQLGTPITSLMGWVDYLDLKINDPETIGEIRKDVTRLQNIADRFSKIGSKPILKSINLSSTIDNCVKYLKTRSSDKVIFNVDIEPDIKTEANSTLLEWVLENLIKNAIDAIKGYGTITISSQVHDSFVAIEISDNGKGIPRKNFKTVFDPGYTTKKRGWGLGLSLTKRIIEEYHKGKIYVKESEPLKKTTFRIILPTHVSN
ncbi:ATP-binding protein [Plebeiibacterium marinum]|uniref:histidine kinase n=1 Tax=Plebeiibacterium marinum TaxID=2992111 RepID=A0AAE3MDP0_9BACT|nr:ATP-binding protein [Plebeiobacterium marinum]MCW3805834.1 HAMP domain-containing histidine kinase [Plebeiobacterium marinum]